MRHQITAGLLGAALVTASCGGESEPPRSSAILTDSAGIMIVDNGELDPGLDLLASPVPALQIGVLTGAPELQLFRVSDVKRLSDGGVAVANTGSRELRIYNTDGSHRATAGGAVVAGDNAAPQIERFPPDGSRMIIRWTATAESASDAEVEDWKERQRHAEWTRGQLPRLERAWAGMDVPPTKPYYGRVAVGSDGTIWAGPVEAPPESTRLMAFSAGGRYLGTVEVPGRFTPHDSGPGWLLGLVRDENDVDFVQLFALESG